MKKFLLNVDFDIKGKKAGDVIALEMREGVIVDQFWRDRFKDSLIDGCMNKYSEPKKKKEAVNV